MKSDMPQDQPRDRLVKAITRWQETIGPIPKQYDDDGYSLAGEKLIETIRDLADTVLIVQSGQYLGCPHRDNMYFVERATGCHIGPGEQDSFGWLSGVIEAAPWSCRGTTRWHHEIVYG